MHTRTYYLGNGQYLSPGGAEVLIPKLQAFVESVKKEQEAAALAARTITVNDLVPGAKFVFEGALRVCVAVGCERAMLDPRSNRVRLGPKEIVDLAYTAQELGYRKV